MTKTVFPTACAIIVLLAALLNASALAQTATSHMVGPFWEVGSGRSSTLVLRNNDPNNSASVLLTVLSHTGSTINSSTLAIAANSLSSVALGSISGTTGDWGGLQLSVTGSANHIQGKVEVTGPSGDSVEFPVQGGYAFDMENALFAPWYFPDQGTDGRIMLFNSSSASIVVSPSITAAGKEQAVAAVSLAAGETKQLTLRSLLTDATQTSGSVILRYSGAAHALQPTFLLENDSTGFYLSSNFGAKHSQMAPQRTAWHFPDVLVSSPTDKTSPSPYPLQNYVLLSNGTTSSVNLSPTVFYGYAGKVSSTAVAIAPLGALETRLVDLTQLLSTNAVPAKVLRYALTLTHDGLAGDVGITFFGLASDGTVRGRSDGVILNSGVQDSSYWDARKNIGIVPQVSNKTSGSTAAQGVLHYQTFFGVQSYILPNLSVPASASAPLSIKSQLNSNVADPNGFLPPSNLASGTVTLVVPSAQTAVSSMAAVCIAAEGCTSTPTSFSTGNTSSAPSPTVQFATTTTTSCGAAPTITSISPDGAPFDTQASITINGTNLDDPSIRLDIGGGITATIQGTPTATEIQATLMLGGETTVGAQKIDVLSSYGHSNSEMFTVGDPTPSILGVSPLSWPAGATTHVTITGTGFGTNPKVQLSDPNIIWMLVSATDDGGSGGATIVGNATVPNCTSFEGVDINITSQGYSGLGFAPSTPGQSPQSPIFGVTVEPLPATAPTISFQGQVVSAIQSVVVGQQIALTGNIPSPQNQCVMSQTWSGPTSSNANGGWTATTSPPLGQSNPLPSNSTGSYSFYWVAASTYSVTYTYQLTNGNNGSVTQQFKVSAPTSVTVYKCGGNQSKCVANGPLGTVNVNGTYLELGDTKTNYGIVFTASDSTSSPPGKFTWVQLITNDVYTRTPIGGGAVKTCHPHEIPAVGVFPALDTQYPYPVPSVDTTTDDNPSTTLPSGYNKVTRTFSAKMNVMWTPTAASGCTASTCTIPVPLGYVSWSFSGTATFANNVWTLNSGSASGNNFVASSSYPTWTSWVDYVGSVCQ